MMLRCEMRCNAGTRGVSGKCAVQAGDTVTVEMHQVGRLMTHRYTSLGLVEVLNKRSQQPGERSCKNEAIGGAHYGPIIVYMTKVSDASTADGSTGWFKIYENGWAAANKGAADNDLWGVKDMNNCCGKVDVKIPAQLAHRGFRALAFIRRDDKVLFRSTFHGMDRKIFQHEMQVVHERLYSFRCPFNLRHLETKLEVEPPRILLYPGQSNRFMPQFTRRTVLLVVRDSPRHYLKT